MGRKKRLRKTVAMLLLCGLSQLAAGQDVIKGRASYYSNKLHGRPMSNGQLYNKDSLTCAHKKFPFGTLLKVKNVLNGREVIVKVTDRGPFCKRYIIDLSFAAAKQLGIISAGFSPVEIEPYTENQVPYLPKDTLPTIPELDLQYTPAATYPDPAWQRDTLNQQKPESPQTELKEKKSS